MRTLRLTMAYDGTRYQGWQRQAKNRSAFGVWRSERSQASPNDERQTPNGRERRLHRQPLTVQGVLETTLSHILQERVIVVGSGRTDSGVHALAQVAHIRIRNRMPSAALQRAANHVLPADIVVSGIRRAPAHFHARFSVARKRYRYRLAVGPRPSPFERHYVYHVRSPLRLAPMRQAARALRGRNDFAPFQVAGGRHGATTRRVMQARWLRRNGELWFEIEANGFLYKMVRRIVGTLLDVGRGRRPPTVIRDILQQGESRWVGPTAPAQGLTLVSVSYGRRASR